MIIIKQRYALCFMVKFEAITGLLLRSGRDGDFADSEIETTFDDRLHINGYVLASLLRRALSRCQSGAKLAKEIGNYDAQNNSVSRLWIEPCFIDPQHFVKIINPGIRIDREWGSVADKSLYSDELAYIFCPFNVKFIIFLQKEEIEDTINAILDAMQVIGSGIENIGGGWSYGFGKLTPVSIKWRCLDLTQAMDRNILWNISESDYSNIINKQEILSRKVSINPNKNWTIIDVNLELSDGQLLAIHTDIADFGIDINHYDSLPDSFVFRRPVFRDNTINAVPVLTGKAFRQAVLSSEIERMLRTKKNEAGACLNSSDRKRISVVKKENSTKCFCKRCLWFGDSKAGGIISVHDALFEEYDSVVINRVQLSEHSMANINLFNGEYLTKGKTKLKIIIDHARKHETSSDECVAAVVKLLDEMKADGTAPPGWYRVGATTTCTGQLTVKSYQCSDMR